jgi:ATP-dependent DNA helicase RecG
MSPQEIAQVHLASTGTSLDAFPFTRATIDDLDWEKVRHYITKANETGRRKIPPTDDPQAVLEKLELIKDGQPTFAAVLLFGKAPQQRLSQATVHCGRFKQETVIIDDQLIDGSLIDQIETVMDFIRKNINVAFVMTGSPQRKQVWDYPIPALREAVINAVCHRDYSENTDIQLKIHDDRLTIWSPGGLPHGVTLSELFDPNHSSKPRNKLIAQVFYEVELIERYGSGIGRILSACEAAGLPRPEFEEKFGGFLVIFRRDIYTEEYLRELGLNERQIKAVGSIKQKGKITNKDYRERFGITDRTALRDLTALCEKGILEKVGQTGRNTEYILVTRKSDKPDIFPT